MAAPHVAGVLAALFQVNPLLTANQARDLVLDPGSYDALTDPKARSTSTGGRLNFAKALGNPILPCTLPEWLPSAVSHRRPATQEEHHSPPA